MQKTTAKAATNSKIYTAETAKKAELCQYNGGVVKSQSSTVLASMTASK